MYVFVLGVVLWQDNMDIDLACRFWLIGVFRVKKMSTKLTLVMTTLHMITTKELYVIVLYLVDFCLKISPFYF